MIDWFERGTYSGPIEASMAGLGDRRHWGAGTERQQLVEAV